MRNHVIDFIDRSVLSVLGIVLGADQSELVEGDEEESEETREEIRNRTIQEERVALRKGSSGSALDLEGKLLGTKTVDDEIDEEGIDEYSDDREDDCKHGNHIVGKLKASTA